MHHSTQIFDAQRLVDEVHAMSEEISSLPEPASPSLANGYGITPSSSPPPSHPIAQWYSSDSGTRLYDALLSLCRNEIGNTRAVAASNGQLEFHFDRGAVLAFPYNFPSVAAYIYAPSLSSSNGQAPIMVGLSNGMPSATHAQCAFVLEVKSHLARITASLPPSSAATATPLSRPITPSPSMPAMQVAVATPVAASRPVAYDDDLVLDDDYIAPRRM